MRYAIKWPEYARQWNLMRVNDGRIPEFEREASEAIRHKDIYRQIEAKTGVPWYLVAILHRRESNADFRTYLGNGQPLDHVTTIVPRGRGPFRGPDAFVRGAIDALNIDLLSSVKDWRLEKCLFYCELFNGTGYANRGLPSPYVWGGTNIQKLGKYIRDGVFDSHVVDPQPGCAPLLKMIAHLDSSVVLERET